MTMLQLAQSHLMSLKPYVPGRSIELNFKVSRWTKLASNENCLGSSKAAIEAAIKALNKAHLYPNERRHQVIAKICQHYEHFHVETNQVALGNGSSELIINLVRGLLGPQEAMLYSWPTFVMYRIAAQAEGRISIPVPAKADMSYDLVSMVDKIHQSDHPIKLVFLANPNNPTGNYLNKDELDDLVAAIPKDVVLVIDEAYFEYVIKADYPNSLVYALSRPRTIVLRTFSKVYGLAGLRLGYAIGDPEIIDILCRIRDPFNVNAMVQLSAIAALEDQQHVKRSIQHNLENKPKISLGLTKRGFLVHEGVGNFVIAKRNATMPVIADLCNSLMLHGVIIRPLDSFGLSEWVRISVGTDDEIAHLFIGLDEVLKAG